MKRPSYAQIAALVDEIMTAVLASKIDLTTKEPNDRLIGIVLRHVDSWSTKP